MISSYEEDIKQSRIEVELLTTEDFKEMVGKVDFIEKNPAN